MAEFLFHEDSHRYTLDGEVLPSVTQIISPLTALFYGGVDEDLLAARSELGRAVHADTWTDDQGELDDADVHPLVRPYLEAWRRFRRESGCTIAMGEHPLYHPALRYAGTCDRVLRWNNEGALVDIKTVARVVPTVHVQVAGGYESLLAAAGHDFNIRRRGALQLRADGSYRWHETPLDEIHQHRAAFMGLLSTYRWKERFT